MDQWRERRNQIAQQKGLLGLGILGKNDKLRKGDLNSIQGEERDRAKEILQSRSLKELVEDFGSARVAEFIKHDLLSKEQVEDSQKNAAFNAEQKKQFAKAFSDGFKSVVDRGDGPEARKRWDAMTDSLRRLVIAENKELKNDEDFFKMMNGKAFEDMVKDRKNFTEEEEKEARATRLEGKQNEKGERSGGFKADLASGNADKIDNALKRMSDDEKLDKGVRGAILSDAALARMPRSQAKYIYDNAKDLSDTDRKRLEKRLGADEDTGPARDTRMGGSTATAAAPASTNFGPSLRSTRLGGAPASQTPPPGQSIGGDRANPEDINNIK